MKNQRVQPRENNRDQECKKNDNLKNLDAALAHIVEQQGEQDAQLNKQLIKIMIDSQQQQRRNKNDNTPRW